MPKACLVFTDGSSNGMATYVIHGQVRSEESPYASAQLVGLYAVVRVFLFLTIGPFNLYTDSVYVAYSLPLLKTVA